MLQHIPGGWFAAAEPYLGDRAEDFIVAMWAVEKASLRGESDFYEDLERGLAEYGADVPVEAFHRAVWSSIELEPASIDLVHRLRAAGYGVHLGTNQEQHRGDFMRTELGYDELFDVSCYSHELGAAKPDGTFFTAAVRLIGADPTEVLFIDDLEPNVTGARDVGLTGGAVDDRRRPPEAAGAARRPRRGPLLS